MSQDPNYKAWHNAYIEQHKHWPHGETSWQAGRDFEREKAQSALQAKEAEIAALKLDAERLDHLQNRAATVEILPDGSWWKFRIGGLHSAQSPNIRAAIDSALAAGDGEQTS